MDFCSKCGRELTDSAIGCPNCDATVSNCDNAKDSGKKKILVGAILGAVVVVALVIVLICTLGGGGYEKAVERYINYYYCDMANEENVRPLAPESLWDEWAEHEGFKNADEMFEYMTDKLEKELNELDFYEVDVDFEIKYEEELSQRELDELCERLENKYRTNYSTFTEGYSFEVEIFGSLSGSREGEPIYKDINEEEKLVAVKMNGEWYLADSVGSKMWLIDAVM